jgi:Zn-dependent peptidase ImmA (M78 family)
MPHRLDRMALDDVGANPVRLATAIHDQLGRPQGAVPIEEVARALDIIDIRIEALANIEAALITGPERDEGAVVLNANSNRQRRRFSLAHELGHFLNPWHSPTATSGFECSRSDMTVANQTNQDRHARQEGEANAFAIELLAPRHLADRFTEHVPDLKHVLAMANELQISREASARRYVDVHDENLAVIFARDGRLLYVSRGKKFPSIALRNDDRLPSFRPAPPSTLSSSDEADAETWLRHTTRALTAQTLHQQNGHSITLLHIAEFDDDDDDEIDDTSQRFVRSGR